MICQLYHIFYLWQQLGVILHFKEEIKKIKNNKNYTTHTNILLQNTPSINNDVVYKTVIEFYNSLFIVTKVVICDNET